MLQREPDTSGGIAGFFLFIVAGITVLGVFAYFASQFIVEPAGGIYGYQAVIIFFAVIWVILTAMVGLILYNSHRKSGRT